MKLEHQRFGALFIILISALLCGADCKAQPMMPPSQNDIVPIPSAVKGSPTDVLAELSDIKITREVYDREVAAFKEVSPQAAAQLATIEGRKEFLRQLVEVTMFEKKAKLDGLDKTDEFKRDSHRMAVAALSIEHIKKLLGQVNVDEQTAKKFYEDNKRLFTEPDQYHIFQISTDSKEKADAIVKDLNSGKSFIEVAKASSIDDNKANGGDKGFMHLDDLVPEISTALSSLGADKVSAPISIAENLYVIVKYTEKKDGTVKAFETVSSQIRRDLAGEKQMATFKAEIDRLKKLYNFTFDAKVAEYIRKDSITEAESNAVLAKYDGVEIKVSEIYKDLEQIPAFIRPQVLGGEGLNDFLNQHFARVLSLHDVEKNYDTYAKANPKVVNDTARRTIVKMLFDKVLRPVTVNDDEIKDFYNKNLANFSAPAQMQAHHILVKEEEKAKSLLADLQKDPTKFEEVAKSSSICPSKQQGGDLGKFSDGQMVPEFEKACKEAEVGKVVGPVKTQFGYHLIRVDGRTPAGTRKLEEVQEEIRSQLLPQKQKEVFDTFVQSLSKEFNRKEYPENI